MSDTLLEIKNLNISYETDDGVVEALNGVSLRLSVGKTLGLVGETGAGKTTLARGIMRLVPMPPGKIRAGEIIYDGKDLLQLNENEMRKVRGKDISMIFQDPMTSLNPVLTVGEQIEEVIESHNPDLKKNELKEKAGDMLEMVGIPRDRADEFPHQFSGGMKQRVVIAIALACNPKLLIADEPTTALDVTIQAQVLDMINELKSRLNTSMLLITHDLGVVAQNCDEVAIIYAGEVVEQGDLHQIFKDTQHPYTIGLLGSIPSLNEDVDRLNPVNGMMPDPTDLPKGCKFSPRCKYCTSRCEESEPQLEDRGYGHLVRCYKTKEEMK